VVVLSDEHGKVLRRAAPCPGPTAAGLGTVPAPSPNHSSPLVPPMPDRRGQPRPRTWPWPPARRNVKRFAFAL